MAINRIGSYGNYFNYYQTISQIRLQQALSKNTKYQESVKAVDRVSKVNSYYKDTGLDFVKDYHSTIADVMDSANSLRSTNSGSAMNQLEAVSSDSEVAEASLKYQARASKEMSLDVQSLAQAQVNLGASVKGGEKAASDMDFTIAGNNQSISVKVDRLNDNGAAKTNREMLREAAKQINGANGDVYASVIEKDGTSSLKLTGKSTGTSGAFEVSGNMGAAAGAEKAETEAENANYTVTSNNISRSYTSQTNDITLDTGRISAKLKAVGKTDISLQPDADKVTNAMSNLVKSYNNAVSFLNTNANHGSGISAQAKRFGENLGSSSTLERLGLSKDKDGRLSFDDKKFRKSLKEDTELTRSLVSGSSGVAQNMFNKASSAMRVNSNSLVDYDLQEMENGLSIYNPMQFMGTYSRSGSTSVSHAATLGLLMNYLV